MPGSPLALAQRRRAKSLKRMFFPKHPLLVTVALLYLCDGTDLASHVGAPRFLAQGRCPPRRAGRVPDKRTCSGARSAPAPRGLASVRLRYYRQYCVTLPLPSLGALYLVSTAFCVGICSKPPTQWGHVWGQRSQKEPIPPPTCGSLRPSISPLASRTLEYLSTIGDQGTPGDHNYGPLWDPLCWGSCFRGQHVISEGAPPPHMPPPQF